MKQFFRRLAAELIDNKEDSIIMRDRSGVNDAINVAGMSAIERATGCSVSGVGARLTPTKRKQKKGDGSLSNYLYQGYCVVCHSKTTHVCLVCNDDPTVEDEIFVCSTKQKNTFQMCFHEHLTTAHGDGTL
jgi:hypothetical protein